jgi:hypothetical protein
MMAPKRFRITKSAHGFTLLEVMLAGTIMALISIAIFNVFKVSTDTYEAGNREGQILQRSRTIFDSFHQDLQRVHWVAEDQTNKKSREQIEKFQQDLLEAEETGDWDKFDELYGPKRNRTEEQEDPDYIGNPFEKSLMIDLQFFGQDGDLADSINFTTRKVFSVGEPYKPWGLARVTYKLDGPLLIRTEDNIFANPRTLEGEILDKEAPPTHTILASGVEEFSLTYGFWVDNTWFEIDQWESTSKQIRNGNYLKGEYDFEDLQDPNAAPVSGADSELGFGSDAFNDNLNESPNEVYDGLPAYVRMNIALRDPDDEGSTPIRFSRIFRVPGSVETWVRSEKLDEDQRDNEVELRRDEYVEVRPGALKKN